MQHSIIDLSGELSASMDELNLNSEANLSPLMEKNEHDVAKEHNKKDKLQILRRKMDNRMSMLKNQQDKPLGRDMYLQKVSNFLITSFFLNLSIEHIFTYSLLHDYINGYLKNETYILDRKVEGNNFCFILFYSFRLIGLIITKFWFIGIMQKDVGYQNKHRKK